MDRVRRLSRQLLHPPRRVLLLLPPLSFAALVLYFVRGQAVGPVTCTVYALSAYSLSIWLIALPGVTKRAISGIIRIRAVQRIAASPAALRYRADPDFRSALTGGFVWLTVIALALWLLLKRSRKEGRSHGSLEK